jgi:2,3-bisphosphoglycerate-dependent phosphoglycerate mutase
MTEIYFIRHAEPDRSKGDDRTFPLTDKGRRDSKKETEMTEIYFIRHVEPDRSKGEDRTFPLTDKGRRDSKKVTEFLTGKGISAVLSSPFTRAYETVADFGAQAGLTVELIEDFRERKISDGWISDFNSFCERQWNDFTYRLPNGECLSEVQERNIAALRGVLKRYEGKSIAVGTHGCALNTIIHYFDNSYGIKEVMEMLHKMPWAVKMEFDGERFVGMEFIDLIP